MGLDIVLYKHQQKIKVHEIKEALHKAIFSAEKSSLKLNQLHRLKDFYKTNIRLNADEIQLLIHDLSTLMQYLEMKHHSALQALIDCLSADDFTEAHIAGD